MRLTIRIWMAIVQKDWRMNRTFLLSSWLLLSAASVWVTNQGGVSAALIVMSILLVGYGPLYLFIGLHAEAKQRHLWLHTPRPVTALITSKVAASMAATTLSMPLAFLYPFWEIAFRSRSLEMIGLSTRDLVKIGIDVFFILSYGAFSLGILVLFFWSLYHWLYSFTGKWTLFLTFASLILFIAASVSFSETSIYTSLTHWGGPTLLFPWEQLYPGLENVKLQWGEQVLEWVQILGLFMAANWILERNLEI